MYSGVKPSVGEVSNRLLFTPVDPLSIFAADSLDAWNCGRSLAPFRELVPPADPRRDAVELVMRASITPMLPIETSRLMTHLRGDSDLAAALDVPVPALQAWLDRGNVDMLYVYLSAVGMCNAARLEP